MCAVMHGGRIVTRYEACSSHLVARTVCDILLGQLWFFWFVDIITWIHGNHAIKFGYDLNYVTDYSDNLYDQNGTYDYTNALEFAADYYSPNHCDGSTTGAGSLPCYTYYQQGIGSTTFQFQTADYSGFISDEWKLRHGLTLSLGIRYEYEQLPNTNKNLVNPDIPLTATLPHDRNNFGPRLGIAWEDRKSVV